MRTGRKLLGITALSALSAAQACADQARAEPGRTTWTTYVYQGPSTRYAVIDELQQLTEVDVQVCADGWCKIEVGGRPGYLRAEVVTRGDPAAPEPGVLAQPAASLVAAPKGPCFEAMQTGGNGGTMPTRFCEK